MADTRTPKSGDPHDWNSLENYLFLHDKHLDEHPLTLPASHLNNMVLSTPESLYDVIIVEGLIYCSNGLQLEVIKWGDVDRSPSQRVRMKIYAYNAWHPGGHNVLRYDNQHIGEDDAYHRHQFDPKTGKQIDYRTLTRIEFPVMHQILDELMDIVPPDA